ncbi:MAG TPA: hypothetical protein VMA95_12510 [Streptosporangiaceae bacterium]|nr:hypothetical protein [Streptosporangiaceae bacterium]
MSPAHAARLARARELLASSFDTADCVLACYSAARFTEDLRSARDSKLVLITLDDLYRRRA